MNLAQLKIDLKNDEGVKLRLYKDTTGHATIGCGRNLDDVGISNDESDLMLSNDIARVTRSLDIAFPFWRSLSDARQRAMANLCFNMGFAKLLGFRKMLDAIRAGDFDTAAKELLDSAYADQVGNRAVRIANMLQSG